MHPETWNPSHTFASIMLGFMCASSSTLPLR